MALYNQTNVTNFTLEIPDVGISKTFKLNISNALIPGVSIPVTNTPLGTQGIGRANRPGSSFEFDPLVVRALVDEDLNVWLEIYTWMLSLNNYMTLNSEGWEKGVLPKFITLHILNNDKTKVIMSIHYYNAWPQTLGELEFSNTEEGDPPIYCNVTFQYSHFAVEKNGVIIETRKRISEAVGEKTSIGKHPSMR